ncbi:MAG: MFS transporter [Acidimicrobiia bacterium]|nr:MFS transporter [Acidimicrobiia bacterium]
MRSFSRASLGAVTAATMTIATFPIIVFSVLAADLIDDLGVTRAQIGLLVTATALVGALLSPYFGKLTDSVGSVRSVRWALLIGAATLSMVAAAPNYVILVGAALATGIANGWGNPSTNSLIVDNLPAGSRGILTGIKQSGVQMGTFLGGLLLPVFADIWNWRVAVAIFVAIPVAGALGTLGRDDVHGAENLAERPGARLPTSVRWIAIYGFLAGLATWAIFGFLPLFAEEDQLWTGPAAGALIAAVGIIGIGARITWPHLSERRLGHGATLRLLAVLSVVSTALLTAAALDLVGSWVLVPAAVFLGLGTIAWNAVGMVAVMDFAPEGMVGRSTGLVLLGFLLGVAGGAPAMGLSVDVLGSYVPGWVGAATLLAACVLIANRIPAGSTLANR